MLPAPTASMALPVVVPCRYDVEQFQKIEHLTGVKMEAFEAQPKLVPKQAADCADSANPVRVL